MATNTLEILIKVNGTGKATAEIKKLDGTIDKVSVTVDKAGGKFNKLTSSLTSSYTSALKFAGTATAVIGAAVAIGAGIKKLADGFMNYAFEVKDAARITGASAEEMSKLIQVGDDVRISVDSLTRGLWMLSQRGINPTIENIGKLADEYNTLAPGTERNTFLMDNFGRSGREMAKILELGSQRIKEMGEAIEGTGLLMTDEGIKKAEDYYAALDSLSDSAKGAATTIGGELAPVIEGLAITINDAVKFLSMGEEGLRAYQEVITDGIVTQEEYNRLIVNGHNDLGEYLRQMGLTGKVVQDYEDITKEAALATALYSTKLGLTTGKMDELTESILAGAKASELLEKANEDGMVTQEEWVELVILASINQEAFNELISLAADELRQEAAANEKATGALNRFRDALINLGFTEEEVNKLLGLTSDGLTGVGDSAGDAAGELKQYNAEVDRAARQKIIDLKFQFTIPDITGEIGKYFDQKKWEEAGGLAIEAALTEIKNKLAAASDEVTKTMLEQKLKDIALAAEAIKIALGETTKWTAIEDLAKALDIPNQTAAELLAKIRQLMKGGVGAPWIIPVIQGVQNYPGAPGAPGGAPTTGPQNPPYPGAPPPMPGGIGGNVGAPPTGYPGGQFGRSVSPYNTYLVGEAGWELFVPNSAGRIINHQASTQLIGGTKATTINNDFNIYPPQVLDYRQLAREVTREQNRTAAR